MCNPLATAPPPPDSSTPPTLPSWLPADPLSHSTYIYAATHLHPAILSHSSRVYLYALSLATSSSSPWSAPSRLPLLLTAALFHDMGTSPSHDGPLRFEVEGAHAARTHLASHNVSAADAQSVWTAVAVHTSPHIAEHIDPLARLIRLAVLVDFKAEAAKGLVGEEEIGRVEEGLPRAGIEKVLGDVVVEQAVRKPGKAPGGTWVGGMKRSWEAGPEWDGVNREF